MPAGLGTLFVGLLLIVLAFVEGDSVWKSAHQILFGLFGCGSFVLGAAVCYLAILYTRGQDLLMRLLMQSPQRIFPVQVIYEDVWQEPYFYTSNGTGMVHIRNLRMKIEKDPQNPARLQTMWGKGYRFVPGEEKDHA